MARLTVNMLLIIGQVGLLLMTTGALASFNLFMDRLEAQKLLGLPSDIFYVREGVVNEYALNFTVKVPATVEHLRFSWQSFSKRPIQYEMVIEYSNFFALLPPSSNITNVGRVPGKLESFRITLPCSGRINAEIAVNIRFKFHMKHLKGDQSALRGNTTTVTLMRNKICLLQEYVPPPNFDEPPPPPEPTTGKADIIIRGPAPTVAGGVPGGREGEKGSHAGPAIPTTATTTTGTTTSNSTLLLFQDPTPSLLLAGLLGGCAVTATIVFLIFFICLRRKLVPSSSSSSSRSSPLSSSAYSGVGGIINSDPNSSSNNSSPACLLRQPGGLIMDPKWTKESCCDSSTFKDKYSAGGSTIGSRNSYVTIASFWNDIFGTHGNSRQRTGTTTSVGSPLHTCQHQHQHHQQGKRASGGGRHSSYTNGGGQNTLCQSGQMCSHLCHHHHHPHYLMNSTFSPSHQPPLPCNNETNTKGSDVSPYAYAHIVPKIAPPPPPLIEWYSESTCNNGGHIFSNNLFTFQPAPSPHLTATTTAATATVGAHGSNSGGSHSGGGIVGGGPLPPQVPPKIGLGPPSESIPIATANNDGNGSTTTRSTGSGSLIQIDGFQCRKNLIKDGHVVERFL